MSRASDYWASGEGLSDITPEGKAWPEGDDFPRFLVDVVGPGNVVEFGCGTGRLARLFDPVGYTGYDISVHAVRIARRRNPRHRFHVSRDETIAAVGTILAHTVLLHIPDQELSGTIGRFDADRVIVLEILGRDWRHDGLPPVFNRDLADYEAAFAEHGFLLRSKIERRYPHYREAMLSVLEFVR